ncbi:MAG: ArsR family transcriptional regulator [Microbacteriaceae bacterium]
MADTFDVIAVSARRDILTLLLSGDRSTAQIRAALDLEDAAKHLAALAKAGLVVARGEGSTKVWHLDPTPLLDVDSWLIPFLEAAGSFALDGTASVFAAWSGVDMGETIGRAMADRTHQARTAMQDATGKLQDASDLVTSKLPKTVTDRLARKHPNES